MKPVLPLLLLSLTAAEVCAQGTMEREVTLTGVVRLAGSSRPAERARVVLEQRGFHRGQDFTDGNGNFRFFPLGPGEYQLTVYLDGHKPARLTIPITNSSGKHVLVYLEPEPGPETSLAGTVSAAELALPAAARRQYDRGVKALAAGKCGESLPAFRKLTALEPDFPGGFYGLGLSYYFCKEEARAEAALRQAIGLDPEQAPPRVLLARLLNGSGRHDEAMAVVQPAAGKAPLRSDALFELGRALAGLGRINDAADALRRAHVLEAPGAQLHIQLANVLVLRGELRAALEEMDHYLAQDPSGAFAEEVRQKAALLRAELARSTANTP